MEVELRVGFLGRSPTQIQCNLRCCHALCLACEDQADALIVEARDEGREAHKARLILVEAWIEVEICRQAEDVVPELDLPVIAHRIGVPGLEPEYGVELGRCHSKPVFESGDAWLELPVKVHADKQSIRRPSGRVERAELLCRVRPECRRADRLDPGRAGRAGSTGLARASGGAPRRFFRQVTRRAAKAATACATRMS